MKKIAIVIIAYNREKSLNRLLNSIIKANYHNDEVDLIISIDFNENELVYKIADEYIWNYGDKKVIKHDKNLGLRQHVLSCGNFALEYESIIVLEDDIFVSSGFYNFSKKAIEYYKSDIRVAGISLYSPNYNENCRRPFIPIKDLGDTYFMQYPSSWGQIWTTNQWKEFKKWYDKKENRNIRNCNNIPKNVLSWPESSWKKYFIKYMVDQDKYFVYPYNSLSTNFGDEGTHFRSETSTFQVAISNLNETSNYEFINLDECKSIYDVYLENLNLKNEFSKKFNRKVTIDLYGTKDYKIDGYLLSCNDYDYKILEQYDMKLRPHEMNIYSNTNGEYFKLYDVNICEKNKKINKKYQTIVYDLYSLNKISIALRFIKGRFIIYIKYIYNKFMKSKNK